MAKIKIGKEFHFEMAHALWNYDGKCGNIHGHTYKLIVIVEGETLDNPNDPKNGMVVDFGILKDIIQKNIIDTHDHYLVVNGNSPHANIDFEKYGIKLVHKKPYQPTCENILLDFVNILKEKLPKNVRLVSVRLYETPTSFAEWNAD